MPLTFTQDRENASPRCTLDCGFKTSESPALRGFVGGLRALATAALYLVLKSNGLRHSKNPPVVQLFAQNRSRKYRQKVTATTPSQTASYPDFQLLVQTAHVRFHGRKWVHTRLSEKDRTQGHTRRNRGLFRAGVVLLPSERSARFGTTPRGQMSERRTLPLLGLGRRRF